MTFLLIVPFWLLIVRPQQQQRAAHRAFVAALTPGDRIEGFSGIHGTITEVGDETVQVEIAEGVVVTMAKLAVSGRVDDQGRRTPDDATGVARAGGRPRVEEPVTPAPDAPTEPSARPEGDAR
jgi:preprotein translocase subunit YajC